MSLPLVCVTLGDMNGIGPEVVLKASEQVRADCVPVLVADRGVVEQALHETGCQRRLQLLDAQAPWAIDPESIACVDTGTQAARHRQPGQPSREAGVDTVLAQDTAFRLAGSGRVAASVMGPVNGDSVRLSGLRQTAMDPALGPFYLFLASGPLRIAHLTDHVPLVQVCTQEVRRDKVLALLRSLDDHLRRWGQGRRRIAVAGLNPHCLGAEDRDQIAPAVADARAQGIEAEGPLPADSVFRACIEGRYDAVAAMYHDQGHIALKTWGFSAGTTVFMGLPFLHLTVAHGSAYDIAGQGIADPGPMVEALRLAARLGTGQGFG